MSAHENLQRAEELVTMLVGDRLDLTGELPGVREALVDAILARLDVIDRRTRQQFDHFRTPSSDRIPDVFYAYEQETENELQRVAAGVRAAMALGGILGDPVEVERALATALTDGGGWARRSEASRVPRPATRPAVLQWSLPPIPWVNDEYPAWPPAAADELVGVRQLTGTDAQPARVVEEPYRNWVQLGLFERQRTLPSKHPSQPGRQITLMSGLEVCDGAAPRHSAPLSEQPPDLWASPYTDLVRGLDQSRACQVVSADRGPLTAIVNYRQAAGSPAYDRGLGLNEFCLAPRVEVVALLGLRPEAPAIRHVLVDARGPALVCRQWRSYLIHAGDYGPLVPAIQGADLIVRPDLFDTLEAAIGAECLGLGLVVRHHETPALDDGTDDQ